MKTKTNHFSAPLVEMTVQKLGMLQLCLVEVMLLTKMIPEAISVQLFHLVAIKNTMQTIYPQGNQFNIMTTDLVRPPQGTSS